MLRFSVDVRNYFVMAIMGIEYTINLTNAGLNRYFTWLSDDHNKSILKDRKI